MDERVIGVSIPKWNDKVVNEDAFSAADHRIAVSDGAGGCGVFANEWSQYLVDQLPTVLPITKFGELDRWVDGLWEAFYNAHEQQAKEGDGMLLNKFYTEGSCATVAVAWRTGTNRWTWMAYGDSVVFHYSRKTKILSHSFTRLADFSHPPRLVSCKDPLEPEGFRSGTFETDDTSIVFAASDALSHYLLMRYELSHCDSYQQELEEELTASTLNAQLLRMAQEESLDFEQGVLQPLLRSATSEHDFSHYLLSLYQKGVLDVDDCTLVAEGHLDAPHEESQRRPRTNVTA